MNFLNIIKAIIRFYLMILLGLLELMYDYYSNPFVVRLYLLCLSYMPEENTIITMSSNLYPEMFTNYINYASAINLREGSKPLALDYTVFHNFEKIDFCIEMTEQVKGYYGCWKMHIFDKKTKLELAVLG